MVILGSLNVNAGFRLVDNERYPGIAEDYQRAFAATKSLHCDLFLGAHGDYYGMEAKFARLAREGAEVWVDPEGYRKYVADRERAFRAEWERQKQPR